MSNVLNKNLHFFVIIIVLVLIGYWYLSSLNSLKNISKRSKYTVAYTTSEWHHKNTTGIGVDYEYYVNNKKYSNTINSNLEKGKKYLLVYDSLKPANNVILDVYPINNYYSTPVNGWHFNELPVVVDSITIKDLILNN